MALDPKLFDLRPTEARLNVTFNGQNGDMPAPVPFNASDQELRAWAFEALANGDIPGIARMPRMNDATMVVDRFPATDTIPYNRIFLRPQTPFG